MRGIEMKIVILDRATLGRDLDISVPIKADIEAYDASPPQTVKERIADADVIFVNKVKLTEENLHGAKSLKLICEAATGIFGLQCGTAYGWHGIISCKQNESLYRLCIKR